MGAILVTDCGNLLHDQCIISLFLPECRQLLTTVADIAYYCSIGTEGSPVQSRVYKKERTHLLDCKPLELPGILR